MYIAHDRVYDAFDYTMHAIIKDAVKSVLRILSAHNKVCCWGPAHWNFNLIKQNKFSYK